MSRAASIPCKYIDILEYAFLVILILNCNTIWTAYENAALNRILRVALVGVVFLYALNDRYIFFKDFDKWLKFGIFLAAYAVVYTALVRVNIKSFFYFEICIFFIYLFVTIAAEKNRGMIILHEYVNLVIIIALVSLFFWLFGSILNVIRPTGVVYSTWTGNDSLKAVPNYYNLYFETQMQDSLGILRNTAIFTEGPMYNFNLCIALFIELFCSKKVSIFRCSVLVISVLTTMTTTGMCMVAIALFAKMMISKDAGAFLQHMRTSSMPLILAVVVIVTVILVVFKLGTSSGSTRMDDFVAGFRAWTTHPFFGAGYGNEDYVKQFMSSFRANNQGFSNSPFHILYQGGIFFAIPYLYAAYKWVKTCIRSRDISWFAFFACFICLFILTITSYRFMAVFIFMAYDFNEVDCREAEIESPSGGYDLIRMAESVCQKSLSKIRTG